MFDDTVFQHSRTQDDDENQATQPQNKEYSNFQPKIGIVAVEDHLLVKQQGYYFFDLFVLHRVLGHLRLQFLFSDQEYISKVIGVRQFSYQLYQKYPQERMEVSQQESLASTLCQ